jgi:hypothetical protein
LLDPEICNNKTNIMTQSRFNRELEKQSRLDDKDEKMGIRVQGKDKAMPNEEETTASEGDPISEDSWEVVENSLDSHDTSIEARFIGCGQKPRTWVSGPPPIPEEISAGDRRDEAS